MEKAEEKPAVLEGFVKPTPYEELCKKITDKNQKRDLWIRTLEGIMLAFSFMRCLLHAGNIPISSGGVDIIMTEIIKGPKVHLVDRIKYVWDTSSSNRSVYFMNQLRLDFLYRIKLGGYSFEEEDSPLTTIALQENLWDYEKDRIDPEKLAEYVKKYNWAFPPNTQELLDEKLAEEKEVDNANS